MYSRTIYGLKLIQLKGRTEHGRFFHYQMGSLNEFSLHSDCQHKNEVLSSKGGFMKLAFVRNTN